MIKMIVVDDEPIIREGIITIVDWEALGITVVGTAGNGRDGLAKALIEKPDIIITDIRMPITDGIKFSSNVREKLPKTRIVFLTGYSDFEYTRHALKVGAVDYLLKPVNTDELIQLMKKLVLEIMQDGKKAAVQVQQQVLVKENLPAMRERCIKAFFNGETSLSQFKTRADILKIHLGEEGYRIIIFSIDYYFQLLAGGEREAALLKYALSNIAEEVFGQIGKVSVCDEGEAKLMLLINAREGTKELARAGKEVQFYMRRYYGGSVSIGIGKLAENLDDLSVSYQKANEAIEERVTQGSNQIIAKEDEGQETVRLERILISQNEEQKLRDAVRLLNRKQIYDTLEDIFQNYIREQKAGRKEAEHLCMHLVLIALREAAFFQLELKQVLGKNYIYYNEISKYETVEDMELWMKDIYNSVFRAIENRRSNKYKGIVMGGISYAKAHVSEPLQAADVARAVYVTPNYFSKLFKEETGENFTEWLNKYRVGMAKKRIEKEPESKIYTIAEESGFSDYKYFAYIFKKHTGYTPTSYRDMIV